MCVRKEGITEPFPCELKGTNKAKMPLSTRPLWLSKPKYRWIAMFEIACSNFTL